MSLPSLARGRSAVVVASAVVLTAGLQPTSALAAPQAPRETVTVTREAPADAGHLQG